VLELGCLFLSGFVFKEFANSLDLGFFKPHLVAAKSQNFALNLPLLKAFFAFLSLIHMKLLTSVLLLKSVFIFDVLFLKLVIFKSLSVVVETVCFVGQTVLVVPQIILLVLGTNLAVVLDGLWDWRFSRLWNLPGSRI